MKLIARITISTIQYLSAMRLSLITMCLFLLSKNSISFAQDFSAYEKLKAGFQKPAGTALPKVYWWWINGNMDTVRMKEELLNIKKAGIGGVDIFEIGFRPDGVMPAGPAFMGPESLKAIGAAIREATKLGLEVGLNLSSSWNAGGTWITSEHSAKSLYQSRLNVKGGDQNFKVPFPAISKTDKNGKPLRIDFAPDGKPVYRKEIAVLAIPAAQSKHLRDTSVILNLTNLFDEKTEVLNWKVPEGDWIIQRYVCSSSGEELKLPSPHSAGPIIDHFDSAATEVHFMYFINMLKPLLGDFSKTALKNFYLASFEATGTVWTPSFADVFKRMHGYDIARFLPYLFDASAFDSLTGAAFKKDYDHTISELMINNHYRKGREIANRYGLKLISESGGPGPPLHNVPVESMKALGTLDVPRGEFWINHSRMDGRTDSIDLLMLVKEIAAASRIYGRKITELESFTSFQNWQEGPGDMRPVGDRAFCEGMNRVVVHGFTHNPSGIGYPGIVYAAGTHYNDKTTWWSKVRPFNEYLSRISFVLQETDFVADVVYYYGDKVPNFATPKNTRFAAGSGYDYEIINTEILLRDLSVAGGVLSLPGGARFKVLALGEVAAENKEVWDKVRALIAKGAVVVSAGGFKKNEGSGGNRFNYSSTFSGTHDLKSNTIYDVPVSKVLNALKIVPDFDYPDKGSDRLDFMQKDAPLLDYIHYKKGSIDFYFVRNTSDRWISRRCLFRQTNKSPELWDPVTGKIATITIYEKNGQTQTALPLTFPPHGSFFVVFNKQNNKVHFTSISSVDAHTPGLSYHEGGIEIIEKGSFELKGGKKAITVNGDRQSFEIDGSWNLRFPEGWGAPSSTEIPRLISWTESDDPGIKYFSGTGTYRKTFVYKLPRVANNERMYLDLGKASKVVEVWLNDKPLGISWTLPHRFDVTAVLKPGENHLRVEVINTWSNRIIGDINSPKKYTYTNLNVRGSRELLWTETPLVESGLLGPVRIETVTAIKPD